LKRFLEAVFVDWGCKQPHPHHQQNPWDPTELKNWSDHELQRFQHPVKKRHHGQTKANKKDHSSALMPSGITAPWRAMRQQPTLLQINTVLASPEWLGQG
jgi:hypothetical protein